jgi:ubiquinone biosynthesis protein COQ9
MDDADYDKALIASAFALAAERGWSRVSVPAAALRADLSLARARERFPSKGTILLRFGRLADQAALAHPPREGGVRDRLFDLLMQRFDVLQTHRGGVLALLRALPVEPDTALLLSLATERSMRWMLGAAGVSVLGVRGDLRAAGLMGVWLWGVRAWRTDETADLSHTMSTVDLALQRAERVEGWVGGGTSRAAAPDGEETPPDEPPAPDGEPSPTPPSPPPPATSLPPEPPA